MKQTDKFGDVGLEWLSGPEKLTDAFNGFRRLRARPETLVHVAADAHFEKVQVAIRYAFAMGRKAVDREKLRRAKTRYDAEQAMSDAPEAVRQALLDILPKTLSKVLVAGGNAGIAILVKKLRAAEEDLGKSSVEIGAENDGEGPSQTISTGPDPSHADTTKSFSEAPNRFGNDSAFRTARPPVKNTGRIGFAFKPGNPAAIAWVEEHAAELAKDLSETTRQDISDALVKAFESGDLRELEGMLIEAVGDIDRAALIARNETMIASNEGQRQSWDQAIDEGMLTGKEKRTWIATDHPTTCPLCETLNDTSAPLGGQYPEPGGNGPPLHVNCRCTEGLIG